MVNCSKNLLPNGVCSFHLDDGLVVFFGVRLLLVGGVSLVALILVAATPTTAAATTRLLIAVIFAAAAANFTLATATGAFALAFAGVAGFDFL